ncbi:MAG: hypothetical protein MK081_02070 [Flavobacteriales bacterium]|nr:hypothetical protein [Flavobacteriales bacterium]
MKSTWLAGIFSIVLVVLPMIMFGQDAPFPDSGGSPCDGPFGPVCPIDGGVSLLVAAGMALGGKKAYDIYRKG